MKGEPFLKAISIVNVWRRYTNILNNDKYVIIFFNCYSEIAFMQKQYQDEALLSEVIACIKAIRKSKKITLEVFYFDTGIHIARIEQGKTNITVSTLSKICSYFEMSLLDFFKKCEEIKSGKID